MNSKKSSRVLLSPIEKPNVASLILGDQTYLTAVEQLPTE